MYSASADDTDINLDNALDAKDGFGVCDVGGSAD